ncbi:hypothetical protein COV89_01055 [Candidatus Shapirobacteria bacterium CG11_big_fil_rev_8_21_14_0_20_40_12]|uniref:Thioredoxin domain-containing protein n=3 Tax=Candidatus Shapironibacteriota TaxID=1752721 RepID=A0A2M8GHQ9_9BACT|nr:MAG: hypothetical protein COV89_01055 [Candidatus Shapirobacteria bacterium CG11_big_fil_rev_8_21_14_0_20_40_12]PJC77049.1 MAG: hypothetical protein CO010_01265 [Candidatus Shapirobacteria bacterium CG_4_8_14_3_um_filter_39_11]
MNKKLIIISIIIITIVALIYSGAKGKENSPTDSQLPTPVTNSSQSSTTPQSVIPADKIEVIHFHATQQCWSCITVGEYALKTIKEKFPEEYASGKIVYKDIDGELKENQEIVVKYQARGSSLFVNAIRDEQDNIEEDVTVWRLINSESQFISYFENKLSSLLGK